MLKDLTHEVVAALAEDLGMLVKKACDAQILFESLQNGKKNKKRHYNLHFQVEK